MVYSMVTWGVLYVPRVITWHLFITGMVPHAAMVLVQYCSNMHYNELPFNQDP